MFVSSASEQFSLDQAAATPLVGELQDYSLAYARSLDDGRVRLASDSRQKALVQAYDDYTDEIWKATGTRVENPYRVSSDSVAFADSIARDPDAMAKWEADRWAKFDGKVSDLAGKFPGLAVKTRDDIQAGIAARVRGIKELADRPGTSVGWAGMGRFVGYAQAALEDPVNAASLIFGGFGAGEALASAAARATIASRLAPVGSTMLREGAVNLATEAATQPQVKGFNNDMGIDYGWDEVAGNVAMAGGAGAVLGGGLHAGGMGLKSLLGKWDTARAAGQVTQDAETRAAEMMLRDAEVMRRANPMPGMDGDAIYSQIAPDVLRSLREGRPIPVDIENRFRQHRSSAMTDLATRAADKATDNAELVIYGVLPPAQVEEIGPRVLALMPEKSRLDHAVRRIDVGSLRHAFNRHGKDAIPFRPDDAAHIADVVERGELVTIAPNSHRRNLPYVERRLLVDGNWLHVGETVIGTERPTLTFQTAFWNKGPGNNGAGSPGGGGRPVAPVSPAAIPGDQAVPMAYVRNDGDSPASATMRRGPAERKTLPPELRPPAGKPPETLVGFLKRQGGVSDADGWLAHMGVDNSMRPGLIAGKGMDLDDAALRAWEEGFFPEFHDRPTPDQLRLQIAADLGPEGMDRVRGSDAAARLEWDAYQSMMDDLDRMGIDPYGKSWSDVQAAIRAAQDSQRAEDDLWKDAFAQVNPEAAQALDAETAFIARTRGELMEGDVAIPVGLTDADNKPLMQSARDTLDAWDDEAMTWETATFCFGKAG